MRFYQARVESREFYSERHAEIAEKVLALVLEIGNSVQPLGISSVFHRDQISTTVLLGLPLQFILPAFPAKSPNPQKTIDHLPDYGEVLALKRLNNLCAKIQTVYPAGAKLKVCSDGRVFSDLVEVDDHAVNEYTAQIRRIIEDNHLNHLSTYCLEDVFPDTSNFGAMREWLTTKYAVPLEVLKERIKTNDDSRYMFNGIHRFLFEDQLVLHPNETKNSLRNRAKHLSYGVIQRSNAWSALLDEKFPSALRLSIHPQLSFSKKLGVRLLESENIWRTPWHSAPLYDGTSYRLVTRKEAEDRGARLIKVDGKYSCFVLESL